MKTNTLGQNGQHTEPQVSGSSKKIKVYYSLKTLMLTLFMMLYRNQEKYAQSTLIHCNY